MFRPSPEIVGEELDEAPDFEAFHYGHRKHLQWQGRYHCSVFCSCCSRSVLSRSMPWTDPNPPDISQSRRVDRRSMSIVAPKSLMLWSALRRVACKRNAWNAWCFAFFLSSYHATMREPFNTWCRFTQYMLQKKQIKNIRVMRHFSTSCKVFDTS